MESSGQWWRGDPLPPVPDVVIAAYRRWEQNYAVFINSMSEESTRRQDCLSHKRQTRFQFRQRAAAAGYMIPHLEKALVNELRNNLVQHVGEPFFIDVQPGQQDQWQHEIDQTQQSLARYREQYQRLKAQPPKESKHIAQGLQRIDHSICYLMRNLAAQYDQLIASYSPEDDQRFQLLRQRKIALKEPKQKHRKPTSQELKKHADNRRTSPQTAYQQQYKFLLSWNQNYPPLGLFDSQELNDWLIIYKLQKTAALVAALIAGQCWPNTDSNYAHEHAKRTKILWQRLINFCQILLEACQDFRKQTSSLRPNHVQLKAYYRVLHEQSQQLIMRTQDQTLREQFNEEVRLWNIQFFEFMGEDFCKTKGREFSCIIPATAY